MPVPLEVHGEPSSSAPGMDVDQCHDAGQSMSDPSTLPSTSQPQGASQPAGLKAFSAKLAARKRLPFTFWIDEAALSSGSTAIVRQALQRFGGRQVGGARPTQRRRFPPPQVLGSHNVQEWELLWTRSKHAREAAPQMGQGQVVNLIPGLHTITGKKKLVASLTAAYGEGAWALTPRSFRLPDDVEGWRQWVEEQGCPGSELWMLKSGANRGKGLSLVKLRDAFSEAARQLQHPQFKRYCVAQQYIREPYIIEGRKFHIRAWVLVTGHHPLRAYLHANSLVLFSTAQYSCSGEEVGSGGGVAEGHVTNYAQNEDGMVWSGAMLREHLGGERFDGLWGEISRSAARVVAAGLAGVQLAEAQLSLPQTLVQQQQQQQQGPQLLQEAQEQRQQQQQPAVAVGRRRGGVDTGFQLLGLDYLMDASLRPWLLEVNEYPSLKVKHSHPPTEELVRREKWGMVTDMLGMVRHRLGRLGKRGPAKHTLELRRLGGFMPLMPLFPIGPAQGGANIPWTAADFKLQDTMREMEGGGRAAEVEEVEEL